MIGITSITSYKIFLIGITFFTCVNMFLLGKKIMKSDIMAIITTILYSGSLYRLTDIYIRAAVGEILAFMFLPLIIFGIYDIIYCDGKKWWVLVAGIFGMANSHMISLGMSIVIIFVFILANISNIVKNKKTMKNILLAGIISVIVCLSIMLPLLEQIRSGEYKVSDAGGDGNSLEWLAITPTQALKSELIFGWAASDSTNMDDLMTLGIGIILYILPALLMFTKNKMDNEKKTIYLFLLIGLISAVLTTKLIPWEKLEVLKTIQYPWRFNLISTLCLSIVSAYSVYNFFENNKKDMCRIVIIILLVIVGIQLDNVDINIVNGNYDYVINWAPIANGEYMPKNFEKGSEYNTKVMNINTKQEYEYTRKGSNITFDYYGTDEN